MRSSSEVERLKASGSHLAIESLTHDRRAKALMLHLHRFTKPLGRVLIYLKKSRVTTFFPF